MSSLLVVTHYRLALCGYHVSKVHVNYAKLITEKVKKFLLILMDPEVSRPVARNFGIRLDTPS